MKCARILVIDNDEGDRYLAVQILRAEGYCVEESTSGARAFEHIQSAPPDLVITKASTRDISGLVLVRHIRAKIDGRQLPIVMYTPISAQAQLEALQAGVNDFLTKPFHRTELIARTRALLSMRKAYCEIAELTARSTQASRESTLRVGGRFFQDHRRRSFIADAEGRITQVARFGKFE